MVKLEQQKSLFISLVGVPNAGKSTLLNKVVGAKISIVSPKAQTTRSSINGIIIRNNSQLVFTDTPGIFTPHEQRKLEKAIVKTAWSSLFNADLVAVVLDSRTGLDPDFIELSNQLKKKNISPVLLMNKVDLLNEAKISALKEEINALELFQEIFEVSALYGSGIEKFMDYLDQEAKPGPWGYQEDEITTAPKRFIAAEIVREKLFLYLEQELPYNVAVETENWQEMENGDVKVHLVIFTVRDSHKKIIIGQNGAMIKKIGAKARVELSELLGQKIHMFLYVKVREDWMNKDYLLSSTY